MKKTTLLAVGILMVFQFFAATDLALGQAICGDGGTCVTAVSSEVNCGPEYDKINMDAGDCGTDSTKFYLCCKAKATSLSCGNGGTCVSSVSSGSSCGAGKEEIVKDYGECGTDSTKYYLCCKTKATLTASTTCSGQSGICTNGTKCGDGYSKIDGSGCPNTSDICCKNDEGNAIVFANPLAFNTVEGLLAKVMATFQGMIVVLCLIFFIWAAIVYITSAGNEERVKSAKSGMTAALIGLALGIAAPSILKTISSILGWDNTSAELASALTFSQIALKVLDFLLGAVGVLGLIMLIIGGIMYFGSAADEKNVEAGKRTVKYAIIGIALALASMVIVRQIAALLT